MRRVVALTYAGTMLLTSCAPMPEQGLADPVHDQVYVCTREPDLVTTTPKHRIVIVRAAANSPVVPPETGSGSKQVVLDFGDGRAQVLEPVRNSSGLLFANAQYAWRLGQGGDVLTDVERVITYSCQPAPAGSSGPAPNQSPASDQSKFGT